MNAALQLCYQHIPSFKRESGGIYHLYATLHSRIYAKRMRHLHRHGQHAPQHGLDPHCSWCGATPER
ncbi:hypothetical protein [Streptomyces sp. NPDC055642]